MRWISNGDPPLYVWEGDEWYNQKDKITYQERIDWKCWSYHEGNYCISNIDFPKKTRVMTKGK
jgi:hypothetical protein